MLTQQWHTTARASPASRHGSVDAPAAGELVAPGLALAEGPDTLDIHTY